MNCVRGWKPVVHGAVLGKPFTNTFHTSRPEGSLKLDLASNFIEQHQPGFIKEVNAAKQRVISALTPKH